MSNVMTKAQFARHLKVNRSTVTSWGKAGRLVIAPNGKVKVAESMALIKQTAGGRDDMAKMHAEKRGSELPADDDLDLSVTSEEIGKDRASYKAQKLGYENKLIQLNAAIEDGRAHKKDDYTRLIAQLGASLRQGMERVIDNLAPQLIGTDDPAERQRRIQTEMQNLIEQTL